MCKYSCISFFADCINVVKYDNQFLYSNSSKISMRSLTKRDSNYTHFCSLNGMYSALLYRHRLSVNMRRNATLPLNICYQDMASPGLLTYIFYVWSCK